MSEYESYTHVRAQLQGATQPRDVGENLSQPRRSIQHDSEYDIDWWDEDLHYVALPRSMEDAIRKNCIGFGGSYSIR